MYVKVTAGRDPREPGLHHGDFLAEVTPPLWTDVVSAPVGSNAERGEAGELLTVGDVDFAAAIGVDGFAALHVLEIAPEQTRFEASRDVFAFRYAWWDGPQRGREGVVTTRHIFVLGANGKTIDRV